jgi:hypothetical protein
MGFLKPDLSTPPAVPVPPPAANPPTFADSSVAAVGSKTRAKAAAANGKGLAGTVKTTPEGLTAPAATAQNKLLGE